MRPDEIEPNHADLVEPTVIGVVVAFRRESRVRSLLASIRRQTRPPEATFVVDNASSRSLRAAVQSSGSSFEYVDFGANLGPAGAMERAYELVAALPCADPWLMRFDDDHTLPDESLCADMADFAASRASADPQTGAVGIVGTRFDWRRGRLLRVPTAELAGPVAVDTLGSNHYPLYRVAPMHDVGPFNGALFFGFSEMEYALRLGRGGYTLYAHGDRWRPLREQRTRPVGARRPGETPWRRYYSLRNEIFAMRSFGHTTTAARIAVRRGLGRPVLHNWRAPRQVLEEARLSIRAVRDGWSGRLGRTIDPTHAIGPDGELPPT